MTARTRRSLSIALAAAFAGGVALAGVGVSAQAPSPPPLPLPSSSPAAAPTISGPPTPFPTPLATPQGRGRRRGPEKSNGPSPAPTATPTSPAFASLDGTWEVQVQYSDHTTYSYLVLKQKDQALTGVWRSGKQESAIVGTYDGRLIKLTVKQPAGDVSFSGYVENASDMVGEIDFGKGTEVAFTAEHRGQANAPHGLLQKY